MQIDQSNADHYTWGDACDGWHLLKSEGLSVIRERMPAGSSEKKHRHQQAATFFYPRGKCPV
jgi:hypothetical protein